MLYAIDPLYWILALPPLLLGIWAQAKVKRAFNKYARVRTARGMTGAEAARAILDMGGMGDVKIEPTRGWLGDQEVNMVEYQGDTERLF